MRLAESLLANFPAAQRRQMVRGWQEKDACSFFTIVTAVWGGGFFLELVIRIMLVYTLTVEQVLIGSPFLRFGFLGGMLLLTLLFARRLRSRRREASDESSSPQEQEASHTPIYD